MIGSREHTGGLSPEELARHRQRERVRAAIRAIPDLQTTEPAIAEDDPHGDLKRAARDARVPVQELGAEKAALEHERIDLLSGHGELSDADRLARLSEIRSRLQDLAVELPKAADALALAESRLQPVLDAEAAAERGDVQQAARAAERALNEKRKALSLEYHQLALRMSEIDRQLNDPSEQFRVIALLRSAGLA